MDFHFTTAWLFFCLFFYLKELMHISLHIWVEYLNVNICHIDFGLKFAKEGAWVTKVLNCLSNYGPHSQISLSVMLYL